MVHYFALHLLICLGIYQVFGLGGLTFQLAFAFYSVFWTEVLNFLEHYGLRRFKDSNGVYESITLMHSWNSVSSPVVFRLQRHGDHHAHKYRPYQILRRFDNSPNFPYEYIYMLFFALVPPMWSFLMDPRVKSCHDA